ncbi:hypothetical protein IP70_19070, partial [alpha proteobacterium AAP38]
MLAFRSSNSATGGTAGPIGQSEPIMKSMVTRAVTGATRRDVLAGGIGLYAAGLLSTTLFPLASAEAGTPPEGTRIMSTVKTKDGTEIFYKDWGPRDAQAIVFHHGWPLSADDWDAQMLF